MGTKVLRKFVFRHVLYSHRLLTCGKSNCTKCPHGPYWYAIVAVPYQRPVVRYIGKELSGDVARFDRGEING